MMQQNLILKSSTQTKSVSGFMPLGWGIMIVLGFGIPWLLTGSIPGAWSWSALLPLAVAIWSVARLIYTGLRGGRRLTLMSFYVFTYVFFGVQPFLSIWYGEFPNRIYMPEALVVSTGFLVLAGIISFEVGYRLRRKSAQPVRRFTSFALYQFSIKKLWFAIVVVVGLSVFVMATYGSYLFLTPRGFSGNVVATVDLSQAATLMVVYGVRVLSAVLLLLGVYMWKARRDLELHKRQLTLLKIALFILSVLNLVVSNPLNAPRLWVGSLGLAILFILLPWKGRRSYLLWATLSCLGLLLLFSGIDPRLTISRSLNRDEQISLDSVLNTVSKQFLDLPTDANFDAFAMLASTVRYADENGYRWGSQLLLPAFFWVPRSIWNAKPEGTHFLVARSLILYSLNVGSPLLGEGYINFGVVGALLFLLIFGRLAGAADAFLVQTAHQMGPPFPTIVSAFFAGNTYILLRGDLTTGTMYLQLMIVTSFLLLGFLQVKHP